jgi:hypothetical protein
MKTTFAVTVLAVGCVGMLTGCAFTKETVVVHYQRPQFVATAATTATTSISMEKLKDVRGTDPPCSPTKASARRLPACI